MSAAAARQAAMEDAAAKKRAAADSKTPPSVEARPAAAAPAAPAKHDPDRQDHGRDDAHGDALGNAHGNRRDDDDDDDEIIGRHPAERTYEGSPAEAPRGLGEISYVVRLLLPEGDKRVLEVGAAPVRIGSGLDEIGLAGDPRVRPGEGTLSVVDGRLWIEALPSSEGIYRRIDGEESIVAGDVILLGDVAAVVQSLPPSKPLNPDALVLGGAAATPCARLAFLRKDGTPGPAHDLPSGKTIIGRTDGHVNFPQDSRLSRRHARFYATDDKITIEDLDSRNGTYLRVRGRRRLEVGDALRVGSAGVQIRGRS